MLLALLLTVTPLEKGVTEFDDGKWQAAVDALEVVVRDASAPVGDRVTAAIHQAAAWRELDQRAKAVEAMKLAAELAPDFRPDPQVFAPEVIAIAEEARALVTGTLEVTAPGPPVAVEVDGRSVGHTPLSLRLARGPHRVVGQLDGRRTPEQVVTVAVGQPAVVTLDGLAPAAPPQASVTASPDSPTRWEVWLPAAGGVALAAAGVTLFAYGQSRGDAIRRGDMGIQQPGELDAAIRSVSTSQTVGVVLGGVGLAALATAAVLGLTGAGSARVSLAVQPGGAAVVFGGALP